MKKWKFFTLPGLEPRPLSRPARSQSLYRLRYPGSLREYVHMTNYSRISPLGTEIPNVPTPFCWAIASLNGYVAWASVFLTLYRRHHLLCPLSQELTVGLPDSLDNRLGGGGFSGSQLEFLLCSLFGEKSSWNATAAKLVIKLSTALWNPKFITVVSVTFGNTFSFPVCSYAQPTSWMLSPCRKLTEQHRKKLTPFQRRVSWRVVWGFERCGTKYLWVPNLVCDIKGGT
jgi:hypothetical protein